MTKLLEEKGKLFDDISTKSIIEQIDINLEQENNPNEFTHPENFNGYNYERNCIYRLLKLVGEENIKILPNLYFFID